MNVLHSLHSVLKSTVLTPISSLTSSKRKRKVGKNEGRSKPKQSILESLFRPVDDTAEFVTRAEWGARQPTRIELLETPVDTIVLKYGTKTDECETREQCVKLLQEIQRRDMDERGMPDIGYNFLISSDGTIYEGRGWTVKSAPYKVKDMRYVDLNSRSVNVAFIGMWTDEPPFADMLSAAADVAVFGEEEGYLRHNWQVFPPSELKKQIIKHDDDLVVKSVRTESKEEEKEWNLITEKVTEGFHRHAGQVLKEGLDMTI